MILAELECTGAARALMSTLSADEDPAVRAAAAQALSEVAWAAENAEPALVAGLKDPHRSVRMACGMALTRLGYWPPPKPSQEPVDAGIGPIAEGGQTAAVGAPGFAAGPRQTVITTPPRPPPEPFSFAKGSRRLASARPEYPEAAAATLRAHPLLKVVVLGSCAADEVNVEGLSLARARALRDRLVALGVPSTQLIVAGAEVGEGGGRWARLLMVDPGRSLAE